MSVDSVVEGAGWALVAVFALAATEKGTSLWTRSAAWHPVMLSNRFRRRWAGPLMAAALVADLLTVVLLVVLPLAGAVTAAVLVAVYTAAAMPVHTAGRGPCRCFWRVLNTTTRPALLGRNAALLALAVTVAVGAPTGRGPSGIAAGAGLLAGLAALAAVLDARPGPAAPRASAAEHGRGRALGITDAAFEAPPHGGELP
jgi:hypothetical protein